MWVTFIINVLFDLQILFYEPFHLASMCLVGKETHELEMKMKHGDSVIY